jgi:hypothetical protein
MFSYHPTKRILEIVPDKYISWQPRTNDELIEKYRALKRVFKGIHIETILINFEKAVQYDRINLVMVVHFANMFSNPPRIEFHKMNETVAILYIRIQPLLNEEVYRNIFIVK